MIPKNKRDEQFEVYKVKVKEYGDNFRKKNIIPKNHDWRPLRWCSRDIVFALTVVQQDRFRNCLGVDVCLMANPPQYFENSGSRVAMNYLLSEAYKCGTSMEIVFTNNVENRLEDGVLKGRVPAYIYDLSRELNIELKHVLEGHITPFEARQMYVELTGFSKMVKEKVMRLSVDELISPERVCFLVMGGIWSTAEAESIVMGSKRPESVLLSNSAPEDRHLYLRDVINARGAILGGALDRKLRKKELMKDGQIIESEDIEVELKISFDSETYCKVYEAVDACEIPWTGIDGQVLKSGEKMVVMVRARSSAEIRGSIKGDLESLAKTVKKYKSIDSNIGVYFLVPRDFEEIPTKESILIKEGMKNLGVSIMVSPETVSSLDREAMNRIETGRVVRHE